MYFNEKFIESLMTEPIQATLRLCQHVFSRLSEGQDWTQQDCILMTDAYALLVEVVDAGILPITLPRPELNGNPGHDCVALNVLFHSVDDHLRAQETQLRLAALRSQYKAALGSGFAYEFSQGDMDRVQALVNEVRELISATNRLDSKHKQRLLARLERLQAEIHKKVSDLDRFWGLIGDAGVVFGKLGTDAKPIVDRIREIAGIVWNTQSRAEELPSGTLPPMIEHKSQGNDDASV